MINLEKEKQICALFGCKLGKLEKEEGPQDIPILTNEGVKDGVLHIKQIHGGTYMKEMVFDGYKVNVYFANWLGSGYIGPRYNNYNILLNLYDLPTYRLEVKKDDEFIGFGLFDFTGTGPKKEEERRKGKKFCSLGEYGFYLKYEKDGRKEELFFSNMAEDSNHPTTAYSHLIQGGNGINVVLRKNREDIQTIARNDLYGMQFFDRVRERLKEIFPDVDDVFSLLISNEEIEKYGLSIYIEPKKEKEKGSKKRKTEKK